MRRRDIHNEFIKSSRYELAHKAIMVGVIFRLRQTEISGPKTLFSVWLRWCHLSNVI